MCPYASSTPSFLSHRSQTATGPQPLSSISSLRRGHQPSAPPPTLPFRCRSATSKRNPSPLITSSTLCIHVLTLLHTPAANSTPAPTPTRMHRQSRAPQVHGGAAGAEGAPPQPPAQLGALLAPHPRAGQVQPRCVHHSHILRFGAHSHVPRHAVPLIPCCSCQCGRFRR